MSQAPTPAHPADAGEGPPRLALTAAGALHAYARAEPDPERRALQAVLAGPELLSPGAWLARDPAHARLLPRAADAGWLAVIHRALQAPDVRLDDFVPQVIAGLSGERRAALASDGGFCVGHTGYSASEAEALCVAAADFTEFAARQRARGWHGASDRVCFHRDVNLLIPTVSFVPFWIDGIDHCLVLGGEPLINQPAFVELIWGLQAAATRFARQLPAGWQGPGQAGGDGAAPAGGRLKPAG